MRRLGDWIDAYIEMTENTEPPEIFHRWVAISAIASCLQRRCKIEWGRLTFYPNLYIVLTSPPGKARKGTAMEPIMRFLEEPELNVKLAAEAITRERLIQVLKESADTYLLPGGFMVAHSSLTICSSELTVFLGYQNLQLITDLTDWFDCKAHWRYSTKNSGEDQIHGVWINMLGATTPSLLKSSLPLDAIGGGLASRMIFIFADRKRGTIATPFVGPKERQLEIDLKADLVEVSNLCGSFTLTSEFIAEWAAWYKAADSDPPFVDGALSAYCERRPTMIMKLSMIMCASRSDDMVITGDDLLRAVDTLEEAEEQMPKALSGVGKNTNADLLARMMAEVKQRKEIKLEELIWMFRNDLTSRETEDMVLMMEAMRCCYYVSQDKRVVWNPKFERR